MRPALDAQIELETFSQTYWLKRELIAFCRQQNISSRGSKAQITARIKAHLRSARPSPVKARSERKRRAAPMPEEFALETVIGEGWRSSKALRAFFEAQLGARFASDAELRDLLRRGQGKTLFEVISVYAEERRHGEPTATIEHSQAPAQPRAAKRSVEAR